ncbi:zinc C2H2 type family protein, putative [Ichthyophthirius multifiliis]|uniref:Zinc C2H2 type family protein, putative n=1 Tax=Ichthyophthirius multifiliis TaxID=5932 RepID=G0QYD4_ICHMU|nr:zinc C2H2 type family protein, putative [Ichthyophthirius multifiliis]EGR29797.1 zinc C2H2 type family protein, putative [Ichthyophthirius multifiliis]|eukprot:XP_004031033.1 zinc C2H2 type family protein, putative [Ichthyophthirius multifiliis]
MNDKINQNQKHDQDLNQVEYDNVDYYQESCKLYLANVLLTNQLKELLSDKQDLISKIQKLEKCSFQNNCGESLFSDDRQKRIRRPAALIKRQFTCPIQKCQKSYGTEGSLQQHIKLKHQEINLKYLQLKSSSVELDDNKNDSSQIQENIINTRNKNAKASEQNYESSIDNQNSDFLQENYSDNQINIQ